jgi:hypothetical protein
VHRTSERDHINVVQLDDPPTRRRDPIALPAAPLALPAAPLAITDGAEIVDAVVVAHTERRTA